MTNLWDPHPRQRRRRSQGGSCFLNLTEEQYRKLKVIPSLRAETA
jgi:hypothetical protein